MWQAFDNLLLLQRGGRTTFFGPLGEESCKLVAYLEAVPGEPAPTQHTGILNPCQPAGLMAGLPTCQQINIHAAGRSRTISQNEGVR